MGILQILATDNFITVNRTVASIVGLEAAVIFGELASESNYWQQHNPDADGWFFSTVENLEKRTYLSAHQQRNAIQRLEDQGWIETEKKGMPARRFIRIKEAEIIKCLNNQSSKILTTSDEKNKRQDVQNFNDIKKNINKKNIEKEKREKKEVPSSEPDPFISNKETGSMTTKEEMEDLLQFTMAAYPNARIKSPEKTIEAWMATLSEYSCDDLFKAIKFHISTNKYFPNPSEISEKIQRARMAYQILEKRNCPEHHPEKDDEIIDLFNFD